MEINSEFLLRYFIEFSILIPVVAFSFIIYKIAAFNFNHCCFDIDFNFAFGLFFGAVCAQGRGNPDAAERSDFRYLFLCG